MIAMNFEWAKYTHTDRQLIVDFDYYVNNMGF